MHHHNITTGKPIDPRRCDSNNNNNNNQLLIIPTTSRRHHHHHHITVLIISLDVFERIVSDGDAESDSSRQLH